MFTRLSVFVTKFRPVSRVTSTQPALRAINTHINTRTKSRTLLRIQNHQSRALLTEARSSIWQRAGKNNKGKNSDNSKGKNKAPAAEEGGDELDLDATRTQMEEVIKAVTKELAGLRIGRADPALVDHVYVNGEPLRSVAQLHVRDATALVVTPYDPSATAELVAAIQSSQGPFALNAQLEGRSIVVPVPKPTKEFREGLIKMATKAVENGKLQVRTVRKDTLSELKGLKLPEDDAKRVEKEVQKIHDDYIKKLDVLGQTKQKDIMKA